MISSPRPASASDFATNVAAMVVALVVLWAVQSYNPATVLSNCVIACIIAATIIATSDYLRFRVHERPSTQLSWTNTRPASVQRVFVKLVGLALPLGVIAAAYWVFPEYHGAFYQPFWTLLKTYGVWLLVAAPFYFWMLDGALIEPCDSYWEAGMLLTGRRPSSWAAIAQHFGGWAVKGFFLPLMIVYLTQELTTTHSWWLRLAGEGRHDGMVWYDFLYHTSFLVDLMFCIIGYSTTLRLFDSHIRSTEPTAGGWLVALVCYQPFYSIVESQYLRYEDGYYWSAWLGSITWLQAMWAAIIIALLFIYSSATVAFGLRFSNLTYRGIITSGPYRFTKHPAYVAKNLSWWLVSIPFISQQGWRDALHNCLALGLINTIYFLRARTEERHLNRDPTYVAYAQWIEQHGMFRFMHRLIPALGYRAPVAQ
jgi:isoprenylcysteine carboxyl methyltransferase (ICMT) family protein YpbQ